ncbi:GNAT family N-acetyltransferase [Salegentibacter sp. F188]|uniref:GNAT family N-acetyltransferase n=1 Tax=Autumnicola patrickiae TaxID=3075591 RepID=A0ABU3E3E0_9FLAO|nr:GNAT family N-acetyltransferase [Salegentibacter sp. F188]MDT0690452.1 GNAT family N-acetyltransferase [Salegentibacter sp. F188]
MKIEVKRFQQLTTEELYQILQLRSEIFVVEQDCVYQDIDGKDQKALHVLGYKDNHLAAYTRCFDKGFYFEEASIGRVLVKENQRRHNYGHKIMEASIEAVREHFKTANIRLSAQQYLIKFYNSHGFSTTGEGYLEDGIPHIAMVNS